MKDMNAGSPAEAKASQAFKTDGINAMERPSLSSRLMTRLIKWAEALNYRYAVHGNPPVYDTADFPWVKELEAAAPAIRAELLPVLQRQSELPNFHDISSEVKAISTDSHWKTFFIYAYGLKSARNIATCPETWKATRKIPGVRAVIFSIFEPGKHLPPHRGPYNGVLRLHVGMVVPEAGPDDLAIRVRDQVCQWKEGKALIFDDAYDHEAWNHTDKTRVVLFVDFAKPTRFPARLINWALLNLAIFTPFIREASEKHKEWESRFHDDVHDDGSAGG